MHLKHVIISLILSLCLYSCKDNDNTVQIIKEWQGKIIELPTYFISITDNDTIDTADADFTIISYFDSLECTSCKLHLANWDRLFDTLNENIGETKVNTILLINTNKINDIKDLIDEEFYSYPIFIDSEDTINHINDFPDEDMFRTFLLDKSHKVLAIGNPLYNSGIKDLYFSIICGQKYFSIDYNSAIFVEKTIHDFGNIKTGETVYDTIKINNIGIDTVRITKLEPSCDCTTSKASSDIIPPGGSTNIDITFKEDNPIGQFYRTIDVFFDNFIQPTTLTITGVVTN